MAISKQPFDNLRTRVNNCLSKLSDRDTLSLATNELECIAKDLSNDSFVPFLNCLSTTDSSEKSPVRRQCVRLLGILSAVHGDALSPHVSRMISSVLRRLRDPDSSVRAACVDAVSSITTHVTVSSFSIIIKPLVDALFQEQDLNAQIGVSMCLSASVEAAREVDGAEARRLLPRVLKLIRMECFKAKHALLMFIGSVVSCGCVKSRSLLSAVVCTAVEFLNSEDWAARKAAAEVLGRLAVAERELVSEFKSKCLAALETRKFDRVKVVRETMNQTLNMWRDVPDESDEVTSSKGSSISGHSPFLLSGSSSVDDGIVTPLPRKSMPVKSPSSSCSTTGSSQKGILRNDQDRKPCSVSARKSDLRKNFRSRVVPFNYNENLDMDYGDAIQKQFGNQKEFEDLSLIREQLLQIENQQSSLLDLLQRFMGNSLKGMNSLEKRVDGLERVLDEMSHDLAISTGRIPATAVSPGNTCCMIPKAEFLSPKFWRRTEGQSLNSKHLSFLKNKPTPGKDTSAHSTVQRSDDA